MNRLTKTQLANLFTQPRERPGTNEKESHRPRVIGDPEIGEVYSSKFISILVFLSFVYLYRSRCLSILSVA
jgi:hypothetical protein